MKTEDSKTEELRALRAFARYQTHGGYTWAAIMNDGALLCEKCVRENYRLVFRATRDKLCDGWALSGLTNSGEHEGGEEFCAQCNKKLWGAARREAKRELFLSDARGIYIPRDFAQSLDRDSIVDGSISAEDLDTLAKGPPGACDSEDDASESYWDIWTDVCDNAVLRGADGTEWTLYQDGDLWLMERGAEYDEATDSYYIYIGS